MLTLHHLAIFIPRLKPIIIKFPGKPSAPSSSQFHRIELETILAADEDLYIALFSCSALQDPKAFCASVEVADK
jgi:hypothetical protein